jgi:hypothetical protein
MRTTSLWKWGTLLASVTLFLAACASPAIDFCTKRGEPNLGIFMGWVSLLFGWTNPCRSRRHIRASRHDLVLGVTRTSRA